MSIAELFIKRPIMTTLVMLAILIFGIAGYRLLPVSDLPNVDYPTIQVSAGLPGANPDTMAAAVAMPLEKQFSTIAGLEQMTSTSSLGSTRISLTFALDRTIDAAAQDVNSMISKAARDLPQNMPAPPSYQKVNPADSPILYLALDSPTMRLSDVDEYAQTMMAQRISMVNGVAQVSVYGSQKYAVRVQLDPKALATRQIGIDEVTQAIQNSNVNLPTGTFDGPKQAFTVQANGQLFDAESYKPVIVAYRNGSPVRLQDVAKVFDSVENDKAASWFINDRQEVNRAIVLAIQRQPGTNTVQVVDNIKELLPQFREQMPAGLNLTIMYDRSQSIRESVNDVKFTLLLSLVLVILVIFLFLRNLSATVIPSLALPFSLVATFAVMYLLGYSLDNLSLMAMTLSVGFVVDDAIVMLENIVRHMEMGEAPMEAALKGSREIGFTIVSMTLSLAAVFIPVLFMGGILGRLLHEFAVTIGVAILVSGFVSLSLTPMLCSRFLKPPNEQKHSKLFDVTERFFDAILHGYDWSLKKVIAHRVTTMVVSGLVLVGTVYLFSIMPTGFLPNEDQGQVMTSTEAQQGISFESLKQHQMAMLDAMLKSPSGKYLGNFMSSVPGGTSNQGQMFMRMKPRDQRPPVDKIIEDLRPIANSIPGLTVYMQNPPSINVGGQRSRAQYQFTLQSPDQNVLYDYAPKLTDKIRKIPGLVDVNNDMLMKNPQVNINIDRDKAAALGLTAQQIEEALFAAYTQRQISTIYDPTNAFRVVLELEDEYQEDPNALAMLYVRSTKTGQLIPVNTVVSVTRSLGPLQVNHLGQLPAVTISFNLKPGEIALGDAVKAVNDAANDKPGFITTSLQGTAAAYKSSTAGLGLLLVMAILVIYIVLGILYESFIHPLTILSGLPAAGFGALLTLQLFRQPFWPLEWRVTDLNIYGFVGLIMLVGIVKKNAIMMIDFALDAQRKEGKSPADAIYEGALVRFRPIMMTTMAALMGTLPIALGIGAGAESRRPLGLAVVGGLMFSQVLTLYITPVVYTYMEQLRSKFSSKKGSDTPSSVGELQREEVETV